MKRKMFFMIAVAVLVIGLWGAFTRKDPIEKMIGQVYLSDGENQESLKGYKVYTNWKGEKTDYDFPEISEKIDNLYNVNSSPEKNQINLLYDKTYYGNLSYTVYDSKLNVVSENQTSLELPGNSGEIYYISISVVWGYEKNNVNMMYYFSINT